MKELKAGQAEQARRQEEQQTKLFDELRTSIQRQEQQLTRLADDHESRLEALTTGQTEAAETVASLEKSFTSTTSAMQDRLGVAEDRLGKLQIPVFPLVYLKQGGPPCLILKHQRKWVEFEAII